MGVGEGGQGKAEPRSEIAGQVEARKGEKRSRKMERDSKPKALMEWHCPACNQGVKLPERLARHMFRCCPELCSADTVGGPIGRSRSILRRIPREHSLAAQGGDEESVDAAQGHEATWKKLRQRPNKAGPLTSEEERDARAALAFAVGREEEVRAAASFVAFHLKPETGKDESVEEEFEVVTSPVTIPLERRAESVQARLGLSADRVDKLLRLYIRSEPLVADSDPLDVIFEDSHWLCVNKPPRVRTAPRHRFEGQSMVNRAIGYLRRKSQSAPNPHVLHRLDMDTSGVLLISKQKDLAAFVQKQFREREVKKQYLCICCGSAPDHFVVDAALERMKDHEVAMRVAPAPAAVAGGGGGGGGEGEASTGAKASKTLFVTVARSQDPVAHENLDFSELHPFDSLRSMDLGARHTYSLICAIPLTGRTHQIRIHVAHAGYPIIGDTLYGLTCSDLMERQALHAFKLKLGRVQEGVHEAENGFLAPLPGDMAACLGKVKIGTHEVGDIERFVQDTIDRGVFL